jgi:hypothetical protein
METQPNQNLGIVVTGSVEKGTDVRLDSSASVEDMVVGRYVTIEGKKRRFFGMVTDISLGVIHRILSPRKFWREPQPTVHCMFYRC